MVCKEDVLSWFKDLDCYKRIDVMHDLLNMCMPFEVRYIASCVEELGKHTYQELRGLMLVANDVDKLSKDSVLTSGLLDENARSRLLLYLPLVSSRNCVSADWMYKTLFRTEVFEEFVVKGNCKDDMLQGELLLLLTMGLHHPAFTFDQKSFFGRLIERLIQQKEHRNDVVPKISGFCIPPGFPYQQPPPPPPVLSSHSDIHVIPNNTSMVLGTSEVPQHPPPGLPIHSVHPPMDLIWQRPTLAGICIPPEVPPFPAPPLSPLVSQPGSPPPSRANSPHRNYAVRSVTGIPLTHNLEMQSNPSQINVETISAPSLIPKYTIKDDEPNHMQEDKVRDHKWMKAPNGLMSYLREAPGYYCHQMQALKLEGENSLHCSTSSSNSSLNQSPPQTPTAAIVTQHGPGRGPEAKPRMNGVPSFMGPPSTCESTPPPPLMSNVPYVNFSAPPHQISLTMPNRCLIPYRPPPYTPDTFTNDQHYTASPYLQYPFRISSMAPPRTLNCYNCGALGHVGAECTSQTIDDITQKPFALEYSRMSDGDK